MRGCWVCSKMVAEGKLRNASRQVEYNYILMMCIAMSGQMEVESARGKAESFVRSRQFCHVHVVHAAQYLLTEMVMAGRRVSHYDDPSGGGRTAYVTDGDIPENLVAAMNRNAQNRISITARGVSSFINDAFKRYYGTATWPLNEEADVGGEAWGSGSIAKVEECTGVVDEAVVDEEEWESLAVKEEEESVVDEREQGTSLEESEGDDESDDTLTSPCKPVLKESNPALLEQYFLVKGARLLQLFQFCPLCGHKLSEMQLNAVGTAAVVKFVCEICNRRTPRVRRWESQERTVAHNRERTQKGNVAGAAAVITTGLR
ncbi:hypothetical protein GCK32_001727 [Trichostrongylus colubriformis]|uniref:Uncharacterized protein n=1 Tax=Trichostrongylus colubriformis TaxID=6319 RepID=A0AAN8IHV6_TRICO